MKSNVRVIGAAPSVSASQVKDIINKSEIEMKKVSKVNELEKLNSSSGSVMVMGYMPGSNKVGLIPASEISSYKAWGGRKWLKSGSTPTAAGTAGDVDFLAKFPELVGLGCYLVRNDHSRDKLSPSNHYLTADGKEAKLDGSMGHYQWGWGVPFYYSRWEDANYEYEAVSFEPIPGHKNWKIPVASCSASGIATMDRTNGVLVSYCNTAAQYRGGNNDASADGTYRSLCGVGASNMTTAAFEAAARKNGDRWCSTFHGMLYIRAALFRIIMGTRDVQAGVVNTLDANGLRRGGLGEGCSYPGDWTGARGYNPFLPMSAGAELGDYTGTFTHKIKNSDNSDLTITGIPSFYGLKNWYKYIWMMSGSMFGYDNGNGTMDFYVMKKLSASPVALTQEAMVKAGTGVGVNGWSYPKNWGSNLLCPVPLDQGATESTYYCDGFYKGANSAGSRLCRFGGRANGGRAAGALCLHASGALSLADAGCGALLCESAEDWDCEGHVVA